MLNDLSCSPAFILQPFILQPFMLQSFMLVNDPLSPRKRDGIWQSVSTLDDHRTDLRRSFPWLGELLLSQRTLMLCDHAGDWPHAAEAPQNDAVSLQGPKRTTESGTFGAMPGLSWYEETESGTLETVLGHLSMRRQCMLRLGLAFEGSSPNNGSNDSDSKHRVWNTRRRGWILWRRMVVELPPTTVFPGIHAPQILAPSGGVTRSSKWPPNAG